MTETPDSQGDTPAASAMNAEQRPSVWQAIAALILGALVASLPCWAFMALPGEVYTRNILSTFALINLAGVIAFLLVGGPVWGVFHRLGFRRLRHAVVAAFILSALLVAFANRYSPDPDDLVQLISDPESPYRVEGSLTAYGWWLVFEQTLSLPLCAVLGATATWFLAYRAPWLTIIGKTRLKLLVAVVAGTLISPLLGAVVAGLATSGHATNAQAYEGGITPAEIDTEILVAAYGPSREKPWDRDSIARFHISSVHLVLSTCGYKFDQFVQLGRSAPGNASVQLTRDHMARYSRGADGIFADAVRMRTTPFGRGFLTACLHSSLYRPICRPVVSSIFDAAYFDSRRRISQVGRDSFSLTRTLICRYVDGVRAREMKAPYLPANDEVTLRP